MDIESERIANFVANTTMSEVNYPPGSFVVNTVSNEFLRHCASKGKILLPKPEIILKGYSGIIVAQAVLEPQLSIEESSLPYTSQIDRRMPFVRRLSLSFSAVGVEWMGVKHINDSVWINESVGLSLQGEPCRTPLLGHVINSEDEEGKLTGSKKQGIYILAAGRFRELDYVVKFMVKFDGITLVD